MDFLDEPGLRQLWEKIKRLVTGQTSGYALDSEVVHISGAETISGPKTFSGGVTVANGAVISGGAEVSGRFAISSGGADFEIPSGDPNDATKFLRGDGAWAEITSAASADTITTTLPISLGGTGESTKNMAVSALFNDNVGSNAAYLLGATSTFASAGYVDANDAKALLGITQSDIVSTIGTEPVASAGIATNASSLGGVAASNYVTTNTAQDITGEKTFVGQKKLKFQQSGASDKLGFTLYNSAGVEQGYLEYNPTNKINGAPLLTLGNYASAAAGVAYVGFRKFSNITGSAGAYNLLTPLIADAKTPFSLTTTYSNFFLPLGVTDGTSMVVTDSSGVLNISALLPSGYTLPPATTTSIGGVVIGSGLDVTSAGDISVDSAYVSSAALDAVSSGGYITTSEASTIIADQISSGGYAIDSEVVHISGSETIVGPKRFADGVTFSSGTTFSGGAVFSHGASIQSGLSVDTLLANGAATFNSGATISGFATVEGNATVSGNLTVTGTISGTVMSAASAGSATSAGYATSAGTVASAGVADGLTATADSGYVHISGDEAISGGKTFVGNLRTSGANPIIQDTDSTWDITATSRSATQNKLFVAALDKNGYRIGGLEVSLATGGDRDIHYTMRNRANTGWINDFHLYENASGIPEVLIQNNAKFNKGITVTSDSVISGSLVVSGGIKNTNLTKSTNTGYYVSETMVGQGAVSLNQSTFGAVFNAPTKNYRVALATFPSSDDNVQLYSVTNANVSAGTNTKAKSLYWNASTGALSCDGGFAGNANTATTAASCTGNAATATNATSWGGYTADIGTNNTTDTWILVAKNNSIQHCVRTAMTVGSATVAGSCTGNAATASSCTGNAATATKASSCTGNAATATNAGNGAYSGGANCICFSGSNFKIQGGRIAANSAGAQITFPKAFASAATVKVVIAAAGNGAGTTGSGYLPFVDSSTITTTGFKAWARLVAQGGTVKYNNCNCCYIAIGV